MPWVRCLHRCRTKVLPLHPKTKRFPGGPFHAAGLSATIGRSGYHLPYPWLRRRRLQDNARWLDAEDAAMRQVLAWAMGHDTEVALRLAGALEFWWYLRGRYHGLYPLLAELTGCAEPGSARWCRAQQMAGWAATFSFDPDVALRHFTVLRDAVTDRSPSWALAEALNGRATALFNRASAPRQLRREREACLQAIG